ncbi:MAG: hypothetical protein OEN00_16470 [Gemmatimonadota bacterium]|nr:hypothetical protein [Gemmatimonadota bacterium]
MSAWLSATLALASSRSPVIARVTVALMVSRLAVRSAASDASGWFTYRRANDASLANHSRTRASTGSSTLSESMIERSSRAMA